MAAATDHNPHGVEVGQVWADNDKRMAGREVRVLAVGETHALAEDMGGRRTRIRLDRFNGAGYDGFRRTL